MEDYANNLIQGYDACHTEYTRYKSIVRLVRRDVTIRSSNGYTRLCAEVINGHFDTIDIQWDNFDPYYTSRYAKNAERSKEYYEYKAEVRKRELLYRQRKQERFPNLKLKYY